MCDPAFIRGARWSTAQQQLFGVERSRRQRAAAQIEWERACVIRPSKHSRCTAESFGLAHALGSVGLARTPTQLAMQAVLAPTAPAVRAASLPGCSSRAAAARRPVALAPPNPLRAAAARRLGLPARGRGRGLAAHAMLSTEQLVGLAIFFSPSVAALIYAYVRGKGNLQDGLSHLLTDVSKVGAGRARGRCLAPCCSQRLHHMMLRGAVDYGRAASARRPLHRPDTSIPTLTSPHFAARIAQQAASRLLLGGSKVLPPKLLLSVGCDRLLGVCAWAAGPLPAQCVGSKNAPVASPLSLYPNSLFCAL